MKITCKISKDPPKAAAAALPTLLKTYPAHLQVVQANFS